MFCFAVLLMLSVWTRVGTLEPRRTIPLNDNGGRHFRQEGVLNYTTVLLREDLNLLIVGAREAVFALDLNDISIKRSMVRWAVDQERQTECSTKGTNAKTYCRNYILTLYTRTDGRMYVCGTNAFQPTCDYMSYADGQLLLENKAVDGKGICPHGPLYTYTSTLVDDMVYSATSIDFDGNVLGLRLYSELTIRRTFEKGATFIHLAHIQEAEESPDGDDDKIYLFFREEAEDYNHINLKFQVSVVARVCRGDRGGVTKMEKQFSSFQQATLDCPVPNVLLPLLIRDVFHFCPDKWTSCVFYAVFTPQSDSSQLSAVCAYSIQDIRTVFSSSAFLEKVYSYELKLFVPFSDELPDPRPGACIDNHARKLGFNRSQGLPDKILEFVKDKYRMSDRVTPVGQKARLLMRGVEFTRIAVTAATAVNGETHHVMFIGTRRGSVLKAVNYAGEMLVILETELFISTVPVKNLKLFNTWLYVFSDVGVMQIPIADCGRYQERLDCVRARDPHCGWDLHGQRCVTVTVTHTPGSVVQNLSYEDAGKFPTETTEEVFFIAGKTVKLGCRPFDQEPIQWQFNGQTIQASDTRFQILSDRLVILGATKDAEGHYTCSSVGNVSGKQIVTRQATYHLKMGFESEKCSRGGAATAYSSTTLLYILVLILVQLYYTF